MSTCECETPGVEVPVLGIKLNLPESIINGGGDGGLRTWESDWFDIAASGAYTFTHGLELSEPWKCAPRLVARIETAINAWKVGDIVFADGANYNGNTNNTEIGWIISVSENEAVVAFGNAAGYAYNNKTGGYNGISKANVKCKLLIDY